jgi:hypothetical protein
MREGLSGEKLATIVMGFWLRWQKVNLSEGKSKAEKPEIGIMLMVRKIAVMKTQLW